jgi:serine/threonine-protein kinase
LPIVVQRGLLGGRYELGPALGAGGFATVFAARDVSRDMDVAVKLVPPPLVGAGPDAVAVRLQREIEVLRKLSSRYVAQIFDWGEDANGVWLVMELVDGVPLSVEALGRALFPHEVLRVARGLLEGLSVAHAAGIVHGDVKPSNVLVPRTREVLDAPKLIDFGLACTTPRADVAREIGEPTRAKGVVVGSARWMAPEVLRGADPTRASDVYAAGLVLFELLGQGSVFAAPSTTDELRARISRDPELDARVPAPLSTVLSGMLARDPSKRYADAARALEAVVDLDTAPVSLAADDPSASRASRPELLPASRPSLAPPRGSLVPPSSRISSPALSRSPIPSVRPSVPASGRALRPSTPPTPRLTTLPAAGIDGLRETLRHLDLAMIDALARRERGNPIGRIARGCALALRLEIDAAALILEPLGMQSDVARAIGATLLAPRARRVTRARVDPDRDDKWIETVPAEIAALLVALATALGGREDAARDAARCERALERLDRAAAGAASSPDGGETARRIDGARITLKIAHGAARARRGEIDPAVALDLAAPLEQGEAHRRTAFDRVVRAMCVASAAMRVDEPRAREELESAVRAASEHGTTLLEACAAASLGRLLVDVPSRADQALSVLERASTLLAHGDAPSLEHEAEHYRAAALVAQGRFADAVPHLRAAREAAHAERAIELEVSSASFEVVSLLAMGDRIPARETVATLGAARIGNAGGRAAALAWLAKCLDTLAGGDREAAEDALAEAKARAREAADDPDAFILVEVLSLLFDAARGQLADVLGPASELERFAQQRGFASFYWFDVLAKVLERLEGRERAPMLDALARLTLLLGPSGRLARDRRTSAPPDMSAG